MSLYRFSIIMFGEDALISSGIKALKSQTYDFNKVQVISGVPLNDAIAMAEGDYTLFLNAADRFEDDALEMADKYFSQPLSCRVMISKLSPKKIKGRKYWNYKSKNNSVKRINRNRAYNRNILTTDGVFFDTDLIKEIRFKENMSFLESQVLFLTEAMLYCGEYNKNLACVIHLTDWAKKKSINASTEFFNELRKQGKSIYVQLIAMTAIQDLINDPERKEEVLEAAKYLDDDLIRNNNSLTVAHRKFLLQAKNPDTQISDNDFNLTSKSLFVIKILKMKGDRITIEGLTYLSTFDNLQHYLETSEGKEFKLETRPYPVADEYCFGDEMIYKGTMFSVTFDAPAGGWFRFKVRDENGNEAIISPSFSGFSKLSNKSPFVYYHNGKNIIKINGDHFYVKKYSRLRHIADESQYLAWLIRGKEYVAAAYRLLRPFYNEKKPIWILEDRPQAAKDNAEHLFRFLNSNKDIKDKYSVYYVLNKDCADFERMSGYGKVLEYDSFKHKMKFLNASKIIAANANNTSINVLGKSKSLYNDLYKFDYVYLRHGVSHNDQSEWLHRFNKNIYILCSTTEREYKSILAGNYGYDESVVKMTGLARYDNLRDFSEKKITIMPTWRRDLQAPLEPRSSRRQYSTAFKKSEYYRFYNGLINDERLIDTMRKYGYTGTFFVHPVFEAQAGDFVGNDVITAHTELADYQQIFGESSVLITDYSSVAFDFAYLKKPIIYSQFDKEAFYSAHAWGKGYFSYDDDGFGDITQTLESTVDKIIYYIENECRMEQKYVDKVNKFFAYTDRNNCRRIFDAIVEKDENEGRI